jgi:hypothetical protein
LIDDSFDQFWAAYPKRVARKDAMKAWQQVHGARHLDAILAALDWQRQQESWVKDGGQYIPLGASWLRGERWTDEPMTQPTGKATTVRNLAVVQKWAHR